MLNTLAPTLSCWQIALQQVVRDPKELLALLNLDSSLLPAAKAAAALFPLKVPRGFIARMEKNNLHDPLLKQVLPLHAELLVTPGFSADPLQEEAVNPLPGLLHKYHGRVLITFVGACGINCRYCFRREFPYSANNPGSEGLEKIIAYIADNTSIEEVILSGGDPLVATDKTLWAFSEKLNHLTHVKRLRIHSRLPIVLPERISPEFIAWVLQLRQKLILVTHCNHPQEINTDVNVAMAQLRQANVVLLNQAVLLKGINDCADTLARLSEKLFTAGILPYYLHLLDKVQGSAHFDIPVAAAKAIHWQLLQRLSGYLVPKLVFEEAGAAAKLPVDLYTA